MEKNIYFVRHGESESNKEKITLGSSASLSENGRKQAKLVAARLINIPLNIIISSSYPRAHETAEIIKENLPLSLISSDLFIEQRKPKEFFKKSKKDPKVIECAKLLELHALDPLWHYSDEENFSEFKVRAKKSIKYLESRKEKNILVVTHGTFMRMFIALSIFGDELDAATYFKFNHGVKTSNTGITFCEYDSCDQQPWKLVSWNDQAHLGEAF